MDKYNNFEWNNFAKLFDIENRYYFVQTSNKSRDYKMHYKESFLPPLFFINILYISFELLMGSLNGVPSFPRSR